MPVPEAAPRSMSGQVSRPVSRKVVLGVTGCIGAYKTPDLVRLLRKRGLRVQVILTRAAREFVSPLSLETVSGEPVLGPLFPSEGFAADTGTGGIRHISLTEETDIFLVAPAGAHAIARLALGLADDFLTTFHLAVRAPTLIAPAMNTNMLDHPAVRTHLETLRARGARIIEPGAGELACGWMGPGRLAELPDLAAAVESVLAASPSAATAAGPGKALSGAPPPPRDLAGRRVVISAGPTREPLDPVRYLSNRSSGRMGIELARAALDRGAAVTLVLGPTALVPPGGAALVRVETAIEMRDAVRAGAVGADAVVMAAAVADFRPEDLSGQKRKAAASRRAFAGPASIRLAPNPDILAGLGAARAENPAAGPPVLIGFAAETADPEAEALRKLDEKRCDLIVGNRVGQDRFGEGSFGDGRVFGSSRTEAVLVERRPEAPPVVSRRAPESKRELADAIWSAAARRLALDPARAAESPSLPSA